MKDKSSPGTIAYQAGDALYLNITNRCPNDCSFCAKGEDYLLWGYSLRLSREPSAEEIIASVKDPSIYSEVVFCGFGEPTCRADVIIQVAEELRKKGARRIRLNTNGLADLLNDRDIVPDLARVLDAVSISLNAQDAETYRHICGPHPPGAYEALLDFLKRCAAAMDDVTASIVVWPEVEEEACRKIAEDLGVQFLVRGK